VSTDKETLYKQTFKQAKSTRGEITRRRVLQTSAALAAGAAVTSNIKEARAAGADTNGPGWYTDDSLTGKVTCLLLLVSGGAFPPQSRFRRFWSVFRM